VFLVEGADVLVLVEDFAAGDLVDIGGGHDAFLVDRKGQRADVVIVGEETDFLEVQDDIRDVLNDAGERLKFVGGAGDAHADDGGALQRGKKHATERVADGVAVTRFKGFSGENGEVGLVGRFLLVEGFRHFEASEADGHSSFV
jgi:hypothetical protein